MLFLCSRFPAPVLIDAYFEHHSNLASLLKKQTTAVWPSASYATSKTASRGIQPLICLFLRSSLQRASTHLKKRLCGTYCVMVCTHIVCTYLGSMDLKYDADFYLLLFCRYLVCGRKPAADQTPKIIFEFPASADWLFCIVAGVNVCDWVNGIGSCPIIEGGQSSGLNRHAGVRRSSLAVLSRR